MYLRGLKRGEKIIKVGKATKEGTKIKFKSMQKGNEYDKFLAETNTIIADYNKRFETNLEPIGQK
jgi:hypothetical protein